MSFFEFVAVIGSAGASTILRRRLVLRPKVACRRAHAYEQALLVIRQLGLPMTTIEEQFRRMVFNVMARNQDDHVKNIAFLMNKAGSWSLAPAFDVTYSFQPGGGGPQYTRCP